MNKLCKLSGKPEPGLCLKSFSVIFIAVALLSQQVLARTSDDFSDGDFTNNPAWQGSTGHFVVNTSWQLQLNNVAAGTSYLSFSLHQDPVRNFEWEFFLKQNFAPSGANFGRYYLVSDQADLSGPLHGYFLQFGEAGSNDAVELFRQSGSSVTTVCRGTAAGIAAGFAIRVKVIRREGGTWQLHVDHAGGRDFRLEAEGIDNTYTSAQFSGIVCTYTITNATRFFLDDVVAMPLAVEDTTPPEVESVRALSERGISVVFSEPVDTASVLQPAAFSLEPGGLAPASVGMHGDRIVMIVPDPPLTNGATLTLVIRNIADVYGNVLVFESREFLYFNPRPLAAGDIIISEVFADPMPQQSLPPAEFVELYNRSPHPVSLDGWTLNDAASSGTLAPGFLFQPGAYVILTPAAYVSTFSTYGSALSVLNFPTLNNGGDELTLKDSGGRVIDSVFYSDTWYRDALKEDGGWTLERINPEERCEEETNWTASMDASGGTPGTRNSVHAVSYDTVGPGLLDVHLLAARSIMLAFDERLNHQLPQQDDITISPDPGVASISFADATMRSLTVELQSALDDDHPYTITVRNIFDCPGNPIRSGAEKAYLNRDAVAPAIIAAEVTSSTKLSVTFSEQVEATSASDVLNYDVAGAGRPASAELSGDGTRVVLTFEAGFANGTRVTLSVRQVRDRAGNEMPAQVVDLFYLEMIPAGFKDVIVTEFCADPLPLVGLPESEFVEVFNRSGHPFRLADWTLSDGATTVPLGDVVLMPGAYLILAPHAAASAFDAFGPSLALASFPSLNNTHDNIVLRDNTGRTIDSLTYSDVWYRNVEKADGGWSIELIDPGNTCAGASNWTASEAPDGGTPGQQNSVYATLPDNRGPRLLHVWAVHTTQLELSFDEKLHKDVPAADQFSIVPEVPVAMVAFGDQSLTTLTLVLKNGISPGQEYTLTVRGIYDCPGNRVEDEFSGATFVLPQPALPGDVIVNEVLFNPRPTGVDFVEIFNRSQKTIDLKDWSVANPTANARAYMISTGSLLLRPGAFVVLTTHANTLQGEYLSGRGETFFGMALPPLNDEAGSVVLYDQQGTLIDSMQYDESMHNIFIANDEGVSLERISPDVAGHAPSNWRSASGVAGFATPGYINSNVRSAFPALAGNVHVDPEIFQPQGVARDFTSIRYRFDQGGFIANVRIVDQAGRAIRELAHNLLLGTEGFLRWDGDLDNGSRARTGYYMVWFEIYDASGARETFRKRVAVY